MSELYEDIRSLNRVMELCYEMLEVADYGDRHREEDSSGVVFGLLRDSAYKIRNAASQQLKHYVDKAESKENHINHKTKEYK